MFHLSQCAVIICIFYVVTVFASREGQSTTTHSCDYVRSVPIEVRYERIFPQSEMPSFYQKYTEAYGIPVLGSETVPDDALKRACYVVRFMLADHDVARESFYRMGGRVAIMAKTEVTLDIPEHSYLPETFNKRARGLGGTEYLPLTTGAEENVLCYKLDPYSDEDIFLHELAHGVHTLALQYVIPGWRERLASAYQHASETELWKNTYAITNQYEYYAEGVQSFFNTNAYRKSTDGVHNSISTNEKLREYDPQLYEVIKEAFPCGNNFLKRCETSRETENKQDLRMGCNPEGGYTFAKETDTCQDDNKMCQYFSFVGYCKTYVSYMTDHCFKSCKLCPDEDCIDTNKHCDYWARIGECELNAPYMHYNCMKSCDTCHLRKQ